MIQKIISGGQTGVDRAALDVASKLRIPCGGWCPRGRMAEDGQIPAKYPLQETPSDQYAQRTVWNVRDSDGTLIIYRGDLSGGTRYTTAVAERLGKHLFILNLDHDDVASGVPQWLEQHAIKLLNVAGPRESQRPGIYTQAKALLLSLLRPPVIEGE